MAVRLLSGFLFIGGNIMVIDRDVYDHEDSIDELLGKLKFLIYAIPEEQSTWGLNMMVDLIHEAIERQEVFWEGLKQKAA